MATRPTTRPHLLVVGLAALVAGVSVAFALDAAGVGRLGSSPSRVAVGLLVSSALGACSGALARVGSRLERLRGLGAGGIVALALAALLLRAPLPWTSLGPFGAGPTGELPLLVLPLAALLAALVAAPPGRAP